MRPDHAQQAPAGHDLEAVQLPDEVRRDLARLGYDPRWVTYGILDLELLAQQVAAHDAPDGDYNTEHYRAAAIAAYLANRSVIADNELAKLVELGHTEAATALADDVFYRLVQRKFLTDAQLELVAKQSERSGFQSLVHRHRLLRKLANHPSSDTLQLCIDEGDAPVHEQLLGLDSVLRTHVEQLATRGANRQIRNMATQLLGSRRFRERDD